MEKVILVSDSKKGKNSKSEEITSKIPQIFTTEASIEILEKVYTVKADIHSYGKPTVDNPSNIQIYREDIAETTAPGEPVPSLFWVLWSYNETAATRKATATKEATMTFPENFYLELSTPSDFFPPFTEVEDGVTKEIFAIKSLSIKYRKGEYIDNMPITGVVGPEPEDGNGDDGGDDGEGGDVTEE